MSKCNWCGREFGTYGDGYGGFCSEKCRRECEASRNASRLSEESAAASRAAEVAAERAESAANRQAEVYEAMQDEIRKQRLDAKAQAMGFIDYPDMLKKTFDENCKKQLEEISAKVQNELETTSKEEADLRLAKYIEKAISNSDNYTRVLYAEMIVKKDFSKKVNFLSLTLTKQLADSLNKKFDLSSTNLIEDVLFGINGSKIYTIDGSKTESNFLLVAFKNFLEVGNNDDEWDSTYWINFISIYDACNYLFEKYCTGNC